MRNRFDAELAQLNVELIKMGSLCELAITDAMSGLLEDKDELLKLVKETDNEIDEKEREIENMCFKLMLQQQPVARDMRTISAALKMITDMERIGDQASDIAEIAEYIEGDDSKHHTHLKSMAESSAAMVRAAIKSFVDKDLDLAYKVMKDDDIVDGHFEEMRKDLIELIRGEETSPELCVDLLMIAKYCERIGDHAVNIAE
ncbi:MAG: phosphate signaling complex protein PhoU, partial [Clostridiales bacterium]|nr:phosphate signaling complex protein PhoU [Clostridiales bacterium]